MNAIAVMMPRPPSGAGSKIRMDGACRPTEAIPEGVRMTNCTVLGLVRSMVDGEKLAVKPWGRLIALKFTVGCPSTGATFNAKVAELPHETLCNTLPALSEKSPFALVTGGDVPVFVMVMMPFSPTSV